MSPRHKEVRTQPSETDDPGAGSIDLIPGMYVRFPIDVDDTPIRGAYREFLIGQIVQIVNSTACAKIQVFEREGTKGLRRISRQVHLDLVRRCMISARAYFIHRDTHRSGRVLISCQRAFTPGKLLRYYVETDGRVEQVTEDTLCVSFEEQFPNPLDQLRDYEFHNPKWKFHRDTMVECFAELDAATLGIEELVGTRIALLAHQAETAARVLSDRLIRYMLADEVGLGKTVEACVILSALRREHRQLRSCIIVPQTLIGQWHNELNFKFWIDLTILNAVPVSEPVPDGPGVIISSESLKQNPQLQDWVRSRQWDLLIVDEAHHLRRDPELFEFTRGLSHATPRALILTATPVQRRALEFLNLLQLMHPEQYGGIHETEFERMLDAQSEIRRRAAFLLRAMNSNEFDPVEFFEEITALSPSLAQDPTRMKLVAAVRPEAPDRGLDAAREVLKYISENYQIETRVIRNRRNNLGIKLPTRSISLDFVYEPDDKESRTLATLHEVASAILKHNNGHPAAAAYCRDLFHTALSSPHALLDLVKDRQAYIDADHPSRNLVDGLNTFPDELARLQNLEWLILEWKKQTEAVLKAVRLDVDPPNLPHRVCQILRAARRILRDPKAKVLVFATYPQTLDILYMTLHRNLGMGAVAVFRKGTSADLLQSEVDRYQADEACRVLLSDESGGEGRNLQAATAIIHADLPWTPTQTEQRIGRVDRLGREGTVLSIVPLAEGTIERDLFNIWHDAFGLFEHSTSGMEIVLEDLQDQIERAFAHDTEAGLADLLPEMRKLAKQLRKEVEEEQFFAAAAIDESKREEFARISAKYRDGEVLRSAVLGWADMAGLCHNFDPHSKVVVFDPREFSFRSIENAKFIDPPDMREALRRSGREHKLVLTGTFDRDLAVRREDIIFLAPGEIWTDAILSNALKTDRGRCCAVLKRDSRLKDAWEGFEFLYRISPDPRPLYSAGLSATYLSRVRGYLRQSTVRVCIGKDGEVLHASHPAFQVLTRPLEGKHVHIGKRSGSSILKDFMRGFPADYWHELIEFAEEVATHELRKQLANTCEATEAAGTTFAANAAGRRAAHLWLHGDQEDSCTAEVREYESISHVLISGLAKPEIQLESACFWVLEPGEVNDRN